MKFTFKKEPRPSGLAGVCFKSHTDIKYNKKVVGSISEVGYNKYSMCLKVVKADIMEDGNLYCINEGADRNAVYSISVEDAKSWGII